MPEFAALIFALAFGLGGTAWIIRHYDLRRVNFRGDRIPAIGGLAFVLGGELFYGCEWLRQGVHTSLASVYFLVTLGFGALGLYDDLAGDRSVGGFRGHFRALRKGQLTTGGVKALGGGILSLAAGYLITAPHSWPYALLAALLIALSANALNLLDLRPGRCLFGFFLGSIAIFALHAAQHALAVGYLLWIAVAFAVILYPLDAGGRLMLGDTGSNAFGAALGVAFAIYLSPLWQVIVVLGLLLFHLLCEKYSLSRTIESHALLRRLDRKIGVR